MEIGTEFFPLPVVVLNHRLIYPAQLLDETYEYQAERDAHDALDRFEAAKAAAQAQQSTPDPTPPIPTTSYAPTTLPSQAPPCSVATQPPLQSTASVAASYPTLPNGLPPLSTLSLSNSQLQPSAHPRAYQTELLVPQPLNGQSQSSRASSATSASNGASLPSAKAGATIRPSLEDFDAAAANSSPFDTLENRALDDRALLSQIIG